MDGVLTLGPSAASWRRRLAPLAWCALEVVAERARPEAEYVVADVSERSVAEELGVAKNTALRALKALRAVGLIEHRQTRDGAGRYDVTTYRLALPAGLLSPACLERVLHGSDEAARSAKLPAVPKRLVHASMVDQLVLLPSD